MSSSIISFNPDTDINDVFNPSLFNTNTINTTTLSSNTIQTNLLNINGLANLLSDPIQNSQSLATTQYVDSKISALIDNSPDVLNTLNELSNALANDPTFSQTVINQLSLKAPLNNPVFTGIVQAPSITLNNVDLDTRLSNDETNINTNSSNITSLQNTKLDKTNAIYSNTYFVNAGVNKLSDVLNSIGNGTSKCIQLSCGGIYESDTTTPVVISQNSLTICSPDCAFQSPSTTIYFPITLSNSSNRIRISNISFNENVLIDGSTGRHTFKACVFNKNFSLAGAMTNFLIFYYCSFSGQINIPNTFAGYIIFYFCDFTGATLNFNQFSNQQIYINSCINLPNGSLNALLNGFNTTVSSSSISTSTLNVSGNVAIPDGSVSISNINGLSTRLTNIESVNTTQNNNITTNTNNITTNTNSINTINNTSIPNLQSQITTNANNIITNTTNISNLQSSKANDSEVVHKTNLNETIEGVKTFSTAPLIGLNTIATTNDITQAISQLVNGSPTTLDTLNELATALGNDPNFATTISNQIGLKANDNSVVHLSGSETITGQKTINNNLIIGSGYNLQVPAIILNGTNLLTTLGNYLLSSTASATYQTISGMSSYVSNSSLTTTLGNYLLSSTASSTYQTIADMTNYLTTNTAQSITGTKTFSRLSENITSGTITSNILTINFSSNNSIVYVSPSANFTVNISNMSTSTQTQSYTFTIWSTAKFYGNVIQVNGTSYTAVAGGGLSNISINASATNLLQQITIIYINSTTPTRVLTNVLSLF